MGYEALAYVQKYCYISMQSIFTLVSLVLGYGTTATIHLSKMYLLAML